MLSWDKVVNSEELKQPTQLVDLVDEQLDQVGGGDSSISFPVIGGQ